MALEPGDPLPDIQLVDAHGGRRSLAPTGGEDTLLVFLRHLA